MPAFSRVFPNSADSPIYSTTLAAAVQTVTIPSLNGDAHIAYRGLLMINAGSAAAASDCLFQPNGSTTNCTVADMLSNNAAATGGSTYAGSHFVTQQGITQVVFTLYAKTGLRRVLKYEYASTTAVPATGIFGYGLVLWNDTSTNLTSLAINGGTANGLGIGTYIGLWKINT